MKRAVISVINDLVTDQRVGRTVQTLRKSGFDVMLIGRRLPWSPDMPDVDYRYIRFRMIFRKGPLFYAFFNIRLFLKLLRQKRPIFFISNDLDTLPANFLASRIRGIPLIYDSHEYFTEVPELQHRPAVRKFWKSIEKRIVPRLKYCITVSDAIAEAYSTTYGTPFAVIRNVAVSRQPIEYPEFHDTYTAMHKVIYQGSLNMGRGLELLIDAMQWISDTTLLIVGDGDIRDQLRNRVREMNLEHKVVFPGRIPPDMLHKITCQCRLGISPEEDMGMNYRLALPNKIFDYIQARIPVLCSNLPEMKALVNNFKIGEVIAERTAGSLAEQITGMLNQNSKRKVWRENLEKAAAELCWETEERKFLHLVDTVVESG